MSRLFQFRKTHQRDPSVEAWLDDHSDELGMLARRWFEAMRRCGDDVRELLHDGQPTACVADVAFAYVGAFRAHVNVGFFLGAQMDDPSKLLEGTGKFMRHVKLKPGRKINEEALAALIETAYLDMRRLLSTSSGSPRTAMGTMAS